MSYNNYCMRLRVKAVQEFDRMYHEPEYKAKCHKRVWKRLGCYIFGISYQSYLDYLKWMFRTFRPHRSRPSKPNANWWTSCSNANCK